jgi:hypothetical protein
MLTMHGHSGQPSSQMKLLLLFVSLLASIPATSSAAQVCVRKSGGLALRESCRRSEQPIAPEALGLVGPPGPPGPLGPTGPVGPTSATLPGNETLRGVFSIASDSGTLSYSLAPLSFGLHVPGIGANGGPYAVYVPLGEQRIECPGSTVQPEAAPGYLCVYESYRANVAFAAICEHHHWAIAEVPDNCDTHTNGALVLARPASPGRVVLVGSWAATASSL